MKIQTCVVATLACSLVGLLMGCSSAGKLYVLAKDGLYGSDGPTVNGFKLSRDDAGYSLAVGGRVRGLGGGEVAHWRTLDSLNFADVTTLQVQSPATEADSIERFLNFQQADCDSPRNTLVDGISKIGPIFRTWTSGSELPHIQLNLFPAGRGFVYFERKSAPSVKELVFPLVQVIPDSHTCQWIKQWSADVVETIVHEMVHVHIFQRFGPEADLLANEVAAYSSGLCVQLELQNKLPARRVLAPPGLDSDSLQDVLQWRSSGRISTTMAGNFLSDRLRRRAMGDRELGENDKNSMREWCGGLIERLFDAAKEAS